MKVVRLRTPTRLEHSFMDQEAIRRPMPYVLLCNAEDYQNTSKFGVLGC